MPQTESETQPELLKLLRSGSLPAELQPHTDEARLQGLLDGRIPTAQAGTDPQGEVYRELARARTSRGAHPAVSHLRGQSAVYGRKVLQLTPRSMDKRHVPEQQSGSIRSLYGKVYGFATSCGEDGHEQFAIVAIPFDI